METPSVLACSVTLAVPLLQLLLELGNGTRELVHATLLGGVRGDGIIELVGKYPHSILQTRL